MYVQSISNHRRFGSQDSFQFSCTVNFRVLQYDDIDTSNTWINKTNKSDQVDISISLSLYNVESDNYVNTFNNSRKFHTVYVCALRSVLVDDLIHARTSLFKMYCENE